jgi:hypothetical protein
MKPNIFTLATKELSQDAFLTWLLEWADDTNQVYDEHLNNCAKQFVEQLVSKSFPEAILEVKKVVAGRQWENIDVWAEINDKYLIIIEDKTTSSQHSNQLIRYKEIAEKWCEEKNYTLICIYIKTGNEALSSLKNVEKQGFQIFSRQDLINLFSKHPSVKNEIFIDFYERLMHLEAANSRYESVEIGKWGADEWTGFYQHIDKKVGLTSWGYVPNPAGGFWSAVLNWEQWTDFPVYLQIEQGKLCFKISTHEGDIDVEETFDRGNVRNQFYGLIIKKAKEQGLTEIRKPDRFGNGNYMTSAIVDREKWIGSDTDIVNPDEVIKRLEKYKSFLRSIIA